MITCPADTTIECSPPAADGTGANCIDNLLDVIITTDSSNTGEATAVFCGSGDTAYSDSVTAGSCDQESTITRTWTATDSEGNIDSCEQIIEVIDNTAPVITCPADTTVNCEGDSSSANTGVATATDNCDNNATISESDSVGSGSCAQESVITRTWTGTEYTADAAD